MARKMTTHASNEHIEKVYWRYAFKSNFPEVKRKLDNVNDRGFWNIKARGNDGAEDYQE